MTTKTRVRKGRSETPRQQVEGKTESNGANVNGGVKPSTPAAGPRRRRPDPVRSRPKDHSLSEHFRQELGPKLRKSISLHRDQWRAIEMLSDGLRNVDMPVFFEAAIYVFFRSLGQGAVTLCTSRSDRIEHCREILKDAPEALTKERAAVSKILGLRSRPSGDPLEAVNDRTGAEGLRVFNITESLTSVNCPNEKCGEIWFDVTADFRIAQGNLFVTCKCGQMFEIQPKLTAPVLMRRGA